jgi:hypothetical protein
MFRGTAGRGMPCVGGWLACRLISAFPVLDMWITRSRGPAQVRRVSSHAMQRVLKPAPVAASRFVPWTSRGFSLSHRKIALHHFLRIDPAGPGRVNSQSLHPRFLVSLQWRMRSENLTLGMLERSCTFRGGCCPADREKTRRIARLTIRTADNQPLTTFLE